jgi:hypothetical protein
MTTTKGNEMNEVGAVVTYKIYGDPENLCTVTISSVSGRRFDGVRVDNNIAVWGFVRDILPYTLEEATK